METSVAAIKVGLYAILISPYSGLCNHLLARPNTL